MSTFINTTHNTHTELFMSALTHAIMFMCMLDWKVESSMLSRNLRRVARPPASINWLTKVLLCVASAVLSPSVYLSHEWCWYWSAGTVNSEYSSNLAM